MNTNLGRTRTATKNTAYETQQRRLANRGARSRGYENRETRARARAAGGRGG